MLPSQSLTLCGGTRCWGESLALQDAAARITRDAARKAGRLVAERQETGRRDHGACGWGGEIFPMPLDIVEADLGCGVICRTFSPGTRDRLA